MTHSVYILLNTTKIYFPHIVFFLFFSFFTTFCSTFAKFISYFTIFPSLLPYFTVIYFIFVKIILTISRSNPYWKTNYSLHNKSALLISLLMSKTLNFSFISSYYISSSIKIYLRNPNIKDSEYIYLLIYT